MAQGLAALIGTLNKLPQIIRSKTPPQRRALQQTAACNSPPPHRTPLLASGTGKLCTGSGSIGAKMPASNIRCNGGEVLLTGGCGKGNTPALQRRALPHQAPSHPPASRCALEQQKDAHEAHRVLQQQPLLKASTIPLFPVEKGVFEVCFTITPPYGSTFRHMELHLLSLSFMLHTC